MKKVYKILNCIIELNANSKIIEYVDSKVIDLDLYKDEVNSYKVNYLENQQMYNFLIKKISLNNYIRFYGEEYKYKYKDNNNMYLIDNNSIIIHNNNTFNIIANNDLAKNQIVYLIRQAIYENYILSNELLLHSASFCNDKSTLLIGKSGSGKTTLLMHNLINNHVNYISNDLVGIYNNHSMASIIPVRIAYGTLSNYDNNIKNPSDKISLNVKDFLSSYDVKMNNNVEIRNIVFPNFNINSDFNIKEIDNDSAFKIIKSQTLNYYDIVRPYNWVNEFDNKNINNDLIEAKIYDLVKQSNIYKIDFGKKINNYEMKRILRI